VHVAEPHAFVPVDDDQVEGAMAYGAVGAAPVHYVNEARLSVDLSQQRLESLAPFRVRVEYGESHCVRSPMGHFMCLDARIPRESKGLAMWHHKDYDKKLSENRPGRKV
jgi:hypothetical protein